MQTTYLDHNATTPLRPEALEALLPYLSAHFGNPSSVHWAGRRAKQGLEEAREQVAALVSAHLSEVLFTSGGTESNNLALRGTLWAARSNGKGTHVITTAIEHSSVLEPLRTLAREGFALTVLPVDHEGRVGADDLSAALRPETVLVSVGLANHEVGTIQPITALSRVTRDRGVLLHVDAVQAAGKLPLDVNSLGVDLLSLSAHKIYGPKGVGALYVRKGTRLMPVWGGGPQEREKRPGTENVAAAVGFGVAATLAAQEIEGNAAHSLSLTTRLWQGILERIPEVSLNSPERDRLPNTLNVGFAGAAAEGLMMGLDLAGIAVSTGSACAAGSIEPSHVLLALGRDEMAAKSALRFSVGKDTTGQEIDRVLEVLPGVVERVRAAARG
ncbi:MAG: cysteine desulfurase [Deltaproteobacteria bacterium]|nr:cysteine desulfurase [Deltaproteobacteria bacterium]